jgi:quinolinate synthase
VENKEIIREIEKLKKEKNAVIVAHNYQNPEIQDIADFVGDSLELAQITTKLKEDMIIFCGVFFMAETAHILAPEKKVLLPVLEADCPMARMVTKEDVLDLKDQRPDAAVVTYVNSTADVKAVSDVCCTSSNVWKIVNSMSEPEIIFIPDRNLGQNIARWVPKEFFYLEGYCPTHENVEEIEIINAKKALPEATVIMHPEVNPNLAKHADKLLSTGGFLNYCKRVSGKSLIIGTEVGLVHRLEKEAPQNHYFNIGRDMICPNMKKIKLEDVLKTLKEECNCIVLENDIRVKARKAIERMLNLS